jgi:hypothetical protein
MCNAAVMVDMMDNDDGVRRLGCELCDQWSEPHLSNEGCMLHLRLKMGLDPTPDEEYTPDEDDILDMDEFMVGFDEE